MTFEEYVPTIDDVTWALRIVGMIRDGGTLLLPTTFLIYIVHHQTRTLTLQNPDILYEDEHSGLTHRRVIKVFDMIGWQVLVKETS